MDYAVSVIVPVYNVEKYLAQCLESLVMQTLESIEIIVVNDGSPDNSQAIIDRYQALFPNKVFSYLKPNGGLGDARNFGLTKAHGQYIGFIDSDDWIEPTMYEKMYSKAIQEESDLVLCDLEYIWEDNDRTLSMSGYVPKLDKPMCNAVFLAPLFAWNKLYHRSLFDQKDLRYPLRLWYEDLPVTLPLFAKAKNITYVQDTFIHYRQRATSIMGSNNSEKLQDIFTVLDIVRKYFVENDLLSEFRDEIEYLYIEHLILYGGFRFMRSNQAITLMNRAFDTVNTAFPQWRKNPYLSTLKLSYRIYLKLLQIWMVPMISNVLKRQGRS